MFRFDVLRCGACGGRRYLLTFLTDPAVIAKILDHLGIEDEASDARARPPPEMVVEASLSHTEFAGF